MATKLTDRQVYELVAKVNKLEGQLSQMNPNTDPMECWDLRRELKAIYKRLNQ